ncbi:MAG: DEAD/DEAH box helicase [Rhodobacterales bacterium]|nr:DEAD/DEAH box helicase [Rhodobacterales bacterium]
MIKLDQFQIDGIKEIKLSNNVLVVAPTGAGKTLIAHEAIKFYLEKRYKVFYTTPIKSLSNQKFNDFKNEGINTGLLTGDRSINRGASLIIGTTEILRNMIFSKDESIQETRLVVLDEVHYLGDRCPQVTFKKISCSFAYSVINHAEKI